MSVKVQAMLLERQVRQLNIMALAEMYTQVQNIL